ncbi:MAG: extracellular solute-binding protein [Candidatus Uhrbacteria bacterium]|nr:extracellular solute-binding protein [Candidatus Uhrbacteria bacterium]
MITRRNFTKLIAALSLLSLLGAGCGGPSDAQIAASKPVKLVVWRVFDTQDTLQPIMTAYQKIHPNVSFEYRELRSDEFKNELLRALAEGNGPDIFSLNNAWIGEYQSLITPLPASLKIPYSEVRGTIKKETVYTVKEQPSISLRSLKTDFVDVVTSDVLRPFQENAKAPVLDRIFGLPLAVDNLALYYNKDLLNAAGFPEPPKTWTDFQAQATKLTHIGANNEISQSGAALGTSKNVERASDILSLLMMQNGTQMTDERGVAIFAVPDTSRKIMALDALNFYTDFANPTKQVYSWNKTQPNSFDAFTSGKTAFFFGYSYHAPLIRAAAPKLPFAIASIPQIEGGKNVNYANYWVETVSKASTNQDFAWDFIQFETSAEQVPQYLKIARKPTARRALINSQMQDEDLSIFASQLLTAKSWYKGKNATVAESAMLDLIDSALAGDDQQQSIQAAQNKVNQTL